MLQIYSDCHVDNTPGERRVFCGSGNYHINDSRVDTRVVSDYSDTGLRKRLSKLNNSKSMMILDVGDCVRDTPERDIVYRNAWRGLRHPTWAWQTMVTLLKAERESWSQEKREKYAADFVRDQILECYSSEQRMKFAKQTTSLYPGVIDFLGEFPEARKIILSRGFDETTQLTKDQLGVERAYPRVFDKAWLASILLSEEFSKGRLIDYLFVAGDSSYEAEIVRMVTEMSANDNRPTIDIDFLQVQPNFSPANIFPETTISGGPGVWQGLEELMR